MQPRVIIFILNWNGADDTIKCIHSLLKIKYGNFSIVVIDNASTDDSVKKIKNAYPDIEIMENRENLGVAGGYNTGLKFFIQTDAYYIVLMNNDILVDAGFLVELIKVAEHDNSIGIVAPKNYYLEPSNKIFSAGSKLHKLYGTTIEIGHNKIDNGQFHQSYELDYATGSAILIKRKVIDSIGIFDERFFMYWEETDFCFRAKKAGHKILFAPEAHIWHKVGSSSGGYATPFYLYYRVRNNLLFIRKHGGYFHWYLFFNFFVIRKMIIIFLSFLVKGKKGIIKKYGAILSGYCDFLTSQFGKKEKYTSML